MKSHAEKLEAYARLIIEVGINVQAGEPVVLACPVEGADFARLLAKYAYARGASEVVIDWYDDALQRLRYEHAPLSVLTTVPDWAYDRLNFYCKKGAGRVSVTAFDPDALAGIDPARIAAEQKAQNERFKPLVDQYILRDGNAWCVAAIPGAAWAKKVFPDLPAKEAVERLWEVIFEVTRIHTEDPVAAWAAHIDLLEQRARRLNEYHFRSLHYRAGNGTDLQVELPDKHLWLAAGSRNARGTLFLPNLPTEEVFTVPSRTGVNGTLVSTRPLVVRGQVVESFRLRFAEGEVVEIESEQAPLLQQLFDEDPNARRLGECALVPDDSPISNSGLLFFNTLFDENASCHFAFGASYPTCLEGGAAMSPEECLAAGANDASLHEDFMVGTADLSIRGTTSDGQEVDVFVDGNFAPHFLD